MFENRRNEIKKCGDYKCDYRCLSKKLYILMALITILTVVYIIEQCDTDEWFVWIGI